MSTLIHQRVRECRSGQYPKRICRINSGWVVLGDVQFVKGYCLILPDPVVSDLNQLNENDRKTFLYEMSVVGDALLVVTQAVRMNYEILGNVEPALHAHIFPRFNDEPEDMRLRPVWFYDWEQAPVFDAKRDKPLMNTISEQLRKRGIVV